MITHNKIAIIGFILIVSTASLFEYMIYVKEWEFWLGGLLMAIVIWLILFLPIKWTKF